MVTKHWMIALSDRRGRVHSRHNNNNDHVLAHTEASIQFTHAYTHTRRHTVNSDRTKKHKTGRVSILFSWRQHNIEYVLGLLQSSQVIVPRKFFLWGSETQLQHGCHFELLQVTPVFHYTSTLAIASDTELNIKIIGFLFRVSQLQILLHRDQKSRNSSCDYTGY